MFLILWHTEDMEIFKYLVHILKYRALSLKKYPFANSAQNTNS